MKSFFVDKVGVDEMGLDKMERLLPLLEITQWMHANYPTQGPHQYHNFYSELHAEAEQDPETDTEMIDD